MLTERWNTLIDAFLRAQRAGGKPKTTCDARRQHLQHLARRVREASPWELTPEALRTYMAAQQWAIETRRGRRTTFVQFWAWGVDAGHVGENTAATLPRVKIAQGVARPAPDRVYHEALMRAGARERVMLRLAAEVGMRRAEVAQVHTRDVTEDMVGHSLLVHGKGGRERVVPLPRSLGRTLAEWEPGYVFPGQDHGHLSPRYVGKLMAELLPDGWTMHALRHRFATRLYALRSDLLMVQEALGHSSPTTTRRYIQYDRDRMRAAMEELAR